MSLATELHSEHWAQIRLGLGNGVRNKHPPHTVGPQWDPPPNRLEELQADFVGGPACRQLLQRVAKNPRNSPDPPGDPPHIRVDFWAWKASVHNRHAMLAMRLFRKHVIPNPTNHWDCL